MTLIPKDKEKTLCKLGRGSECCSYLVMSTGGFACAKETDIESTITQRRVLKMMNALGDNCSGPPDFTPSNKNL